MWGIHGGVLRQEGMDFVARGRTEHRRVARGARLCRKAKALLGKGGAGWETCDQIAIWIAEAE
eukprot:8415376-Alexandrium_andersonii.AAC.1